jgi:four helix bundle protein
MAESSKPPRSYRDLNVWQKAVELAEETYRLAKKLPKSEEFGLGGQLRRASISVAANVAEGHGRRSSRDFQRFLGIAHGSLLEVETLLQLGNRIGYFTAADAEKSLEIARHLGAMLGAFRAALDKQTSGKAAVSRQPSAALVAAG